MMSFRTPLCALPFCIAVGLVVGSVVLALDFPDWVQLTIVASLSLAVSLWVTWEDGDGGRRRIVVVMRSWPPA